MAFKRTKSASPLSSSSTAQTRLPPARHKQCKSNCAAVCAEYLPVDAWRDRTEHRPAPRSPASTDPAANHLPHHLENSAAYSHQSPARAACRSKAGRWQYWVLVRCVSSAENITALSKLFKPCALSLSKGMHGFDKLSPNGS